MHQNNAGQPLHVLHLPESEFSAIIKIRTWVSLSNRSIRPVKRFEDKSRMRILVRFSYDAGIVPEMLVCDMLLHSKAREGVRIGSS